MLSRKRRFLYERFPHTGKVVRDCNRELKGSTTLRPEGRPAWTTIAMAIDYRIRYYFALTPLRNLVAWHGAKVLTEGRLFPDSWYEGLHAEEITGKPIDWSGARIIKGQGVPPNVPDEDVDSFLASIAALKRSAEEFFESLEDVLRRLRPVGRRLEREQEELLARHCVVLALFESSWRSIRLHPKTPLLYPEPKTTAAKLLNIAKDEWVDDLCSLSWAFYDECGGLLSRPTMLNPNFAEGETDISREDADLIVDGCLIDIKTTVRGELKREWLYQLLRYALLDYRDRYRIREVAIYFADSRD